MSKTSWSNTDVFHNYITKHFAKYVNLSKEKSAAPTLILYDGHKSHISLTLTEWAKKYNVVLFVLPPHTSHITQPLEVAVFGPFKSMYNSECQAYMKRNPGPSVTKYEVAHLTSTPYLRALSAEHLISAFHKTGIHPFNNKVITDSQVAPSVIYHEQDPPFEKQDPPAEEQDPPAEELDPPAKDHHSSETLESTSFPAKTTTKDPENESQITTTEKKAVKVPLSVTFSSLEPLPRQLLINQKGNSSRHFYQGIYSKNVMLRSFSLLLKRLNFCQKR